MPTCSVFGRFAVCCTLCLLHAPACQRGGNRATGESPARPVPARRRSRRRGSAPPSASGWGRPGRQEQPQRQGQPRARPAMVSRGP